MVTGGSTSANDSTYGSILCYYASRFPSSFKIPTSFYNSIVGMYVRSTSSGSVSETADIGSRSVSGSISQGQLTDLDLLGRKNRTI